MGDTVTLKVRDLHIPAHPAPGDNHVPFRVRSGSQAKVADIDSGTGWIEPGGGGDLPELSLPDRWRTPRFVRDLDGRQDLVFGEPFPTQRGAEAKERVVPRSVVNLLGDRRRLRATRAEKLLPRKLSWRRQVGEVLRLVLPHVPAPVLVQRRRGYNVAAIPLQVDPAEAFAFLQVYPVGAVTSGRP